MTSEGRRARRSRGVALVAALALAAGGLPAAEGERTAPGDVVAATLRHMERARPPRCLPTRSLVVDTLFGIPLTLEAHLREPELQKALLREVWARASQVTSAAARAEVSAEDVVAALPEVVTVQESPSRGATVARAGEEPVRIPPEVLRRYAGYESGALALLALRQDLQSAGGEGPLPMTTGAVPILGRAVDLVTLASLKLATEAAIEAKRPALDPPSLEEGWTRLTGTSPPPARPRSPTPPPPGSADLGPVRELVSLRRSSYAPFATLSTPLFFRNLQVFFARHRWPEEKGSKERLKDLFNQVMLGLAIDLYRGSEARARVAEHPAIRSEDVLAFAGRFLPHAVDGMEHATFFPLLGEEDRVRVESYDRDAFRDSGLQWSYLGAALDASELQPSLSLDPFAAEALTAMLARFGVLVLRVAGAEARRIRAPALAPEHLTRALTQLQERAALHRRGPAPPPPTPTAPGPSEGSSDRLASRERPRAPAPAQTFFEEVTPTTGVAFTHHSSDWLSRRVRSFAVRGSDTVVLTVPPAFGGAGLAAGDVDGDGLQDLVLVGGLGNRLFLGRGKGRFEDVTEAAGIDWVRPEDGRPGEARQPLLVDLDNDGDQDLLITYAGDAHRLYENTGAARFEDVTEEAGLGGEGLVGGPVTSADFDGDGLLDLYLGYFGAYTEGIQPTPPRESTNGTPNRLLRNRGGLRFEDVTEGSGVADTGWTRVVTHTDLDRDGHQDLVVGNDFGRNAFYRNLGDGRFVDMAALYGTDAPSYTRGITIADLNADRFPDLYLSNVVAWKASPGQDPERSGGDRRSGEGISLEVVEANELYLSKASSDRLQAYQLSDAVDRGYGSTGWAWGAGFLDADNDGDADLYVTNGTHEYAIYPEENPYLLGSDGSPRKVLVAGGGREKNLFFVNSGGALQNASGQSGLDRTGLSRSVVPVDLDGDGDQDLVLADFHGPATVFRNNGERLGNHWLKVELVGDPARGVSRDAIGARLTVTTPDGYTISREVRTTDGYLSQPPREQHFGLGRDGEVTVSVEWPGGESRTHEGVDANRRYLLEQETGELLELP